jgi:hypothetical protein
MDDFVQQKLAELEARAPAKRKKRDPFVKVPLQSAAAAAKATGGQRFMVWLYLLHRSWFEKRTTVSLPNGALRKYGISRDIKRKALADLEAVGLVQVDRRPHKNPRVTLTTLTDT